MTSPSAPWCRCGRCRTGWSGCSASTTAPSPGTPPSDGDDLLLAAPARRRPRRRAPRTASSCWTPCWPPPSTSSSPTRAAIRGPTRSAPPASPWPSCSTWSTARCTVAEDSPHDCGQGARRGRAPAAVLRPAQLQPRPVRPAAAPGVLTRWTWPAHGPHAGHRRRPPLPRPSARSASTPRSSSSTRWCASSSTPCGRSCANGSAGTAARRQRQVKDELPVELDAARAVGRRATGCSTRSWRGLPRPGRGGRAGPGSPAAGRPGQSLSCTTSSRRRPRWPHAADEHIGTRPRRRGRSRSHVRLPDGRALIGTVPDVYEVGAPEIARRREPGSHRPLLLLPLGPEAPPGRLGPLPGTGGGPSRARGRCRDHRARQWAVGGRSPRRTWRPCRPVGGHRRSAGRSPSASLPSSSTSTTGACASRCRCTREPRRRSSTLCGTTETYGPSADAHGTPTAFSFGEAGQPEHLLVLGGVAHGRGPPGRAGTGRRGRPRLDQGTVALRTPGPTPLGSAPRPRAR